MRCDTCGKLVDQGWGTLFRMMEEDGEVLANEGAFFCRSCCPDVIVEAWQSVSDRRVAQKAPAKPRRKRRTQKEVYIAMAEAIQEARWKLDRARREMGMGPL